MTKVLIALSGGMDSATLLGMAIANGLEPKTVAFEYGSKHGRYEQSKAAELANYYEVLDKHCVIDLCCVMDNMKSNLLRSGGAIPEGHYEVPEMSQTVVPGRNLIFASILAGIAWSRGIPAIWMGVHAGDYAIYPDCRPQFVANMQGAVMEGTGGAVNLVTPFLYANKIKIVAEGKRLGVPYMLTRSCYKDQELACGKCGACQERLEAFKANDLVDPVQYE